MKVDFWQLSHDPVEKVVALIAQRVIDTGERLLVVSKSPEQREAISRGLWAAGPQRFLAHGDAAAPAAEEYGSVWLEPITRIAVVPQFCSWSACRMNNTSIARSSTGSTS